MLITSIDHVHITAPTGSEDKIREFYGEVLGLTEIPKPPQLEARGGVWFDCGNLQLHVGVESAPGNAYSRRHVAFRVANLDKIRDVLAGHGIDVEEDSAPLEGLRRFYCRDSVGNRIEFVEVVVEKKAESSQWLATPQVVTEYAVRSGDIERVAVSADGKWLAAGTSAESGDGAPGLTIWRYGSQGEPEIEIELAASLWELAFSPAGKELVALTADGSVETWRAGDFESEQYAEMPEGSAGLAYSPNGQLLAIGCGNTVKVFRPGLDELHTIRPGIGDIEALAFDAEGTLAVSGEAARIQLWQVRPVQLSGWELLGHESPVAHMAFNPHHPLLAAITEAGAVMMWNVNDGPESPITLPDEIADVNALAFSPDGAALACAGQAGRVWLWDPQVESVVAQWDAGSPVVALAFAPDSAHLLTGGADGRVRAWQVK
jgi:WD40 repeat protein/catechol 2,3-dioxygenase-like lactoylglutathione lyase family enzyme